ncbi:hypothetical protein LY474_40395 [Myxococcus stipitatus]|uniref:hypothetical protein n=1 Tax=Myxococcus stipitatus TaxID=83455 RepID=UPI001F176B30|nr:hypothetical protein [Myxococcus stipitatus]MCE9674070.1 hypothetical protein [Myxococcus stipitatus]
MGQATAVFAALLALCLPALAHGRGECSVQTSGAVQLSFEGSGDSVAALSDHWLSPEQLDRLLASNPRAASQNPSLLQATVDKSRKKKGRSRTTGPLVINCLSSEGVNVGDLIILPGKNTQKSLPLKPGTYQLVTNAVKPGELTALLRVKGITYQVSRGGTLSLTRFDSRGVVGTFSFSAQTAPTHNREGTTLRNIKIKGSFDIPSPVPS